MRRLAEQAAERRVDPASLVGRTAGELRAEGWEVPEAVAPEATVDLSEAFEPILDEERRVIEAKEAVLVWRNWNFAARGRQ